MIRALICIIIFYVAVVEGSCIAEPLPSSSYFTPEALDTADLTGMRAEAAGLVAKATPALAAAGELADALTEEDGDAVRKRIAIAERLVSYVDRRLRDGRDEYLLFAWQGAMNGWGHTPRNARFTGLSAISAL